MALSMSERKAVTKELALRYKRAPKKAKGVILDELQSITSWNRDHARRALRLALAPARTRSRPGSSRLVYGEDAFVVLRRLWAVMGAPCGKRLAPFMGELITAMERCGELHLEPALRTKLLQMSPATIDRRLAAERRRLRIKGRSGTKPGSILKSEIAIRTFTEWDDARPGFIEIDLVGHDGGDLRGEFCQTLDITDVASGWTEQRAVKNKAQRWVFEALTDIEKTLPFPLLGIDSDNGSEFINNHLRRYCEEKKITFTRSRPYRKNDSCFIEQKNWSVVRQAVGYARYDTERELMVLNRLYMSLRLFVNFFSPQMKLVSKTRVGARVRRHYDTAATPYQRLMASPEIKPTTKKLLSAQYERLNPVEIRRDILKHQLRLLTLVKAKSGPQPAPKKEVKPAGPSRTSGMRQRKARSRAS